MARYGPAFCASSDLFIKIPISANVTVTFRKEVNAISVKLTASMVFGAN